MAGIPFPEMSEIKPSVLNWVITGLLAVTFIVFMKFAVTKLPHSGFTDFINAV